ncbi:NAD(P)-dependent oxidoreductase [Leifsonia poae]|uniref:NAD(P)-dependent oxidoreductase n=1 Tax=Leifsonia poae TaxID=110933 RepID=UPI003D67059D
MRIAIIGANGGTGIQVVERAAARGHDVIAVVRSPEKLDGLTTTPLTIAQADVTDRGSLVSALQGCDAVVFAVGPASTSAPTTLREMGIRNTVEAAREAGVPGARVIAVSASGISTAGDDPFTRFVLKPIVQRVLREPFRDLRAAELVLTNSESAWTIVRPPRLTDKPRSGHYRSREQKNVTGGLSISRGDLADAVVDLIENPASIRTIVSVAS